MEAADNEHEAEDRTFNTPESALGKPEEAAPGGSKPWSDLSAEQWQAIFRILLEYRGFNEDTGGVLGWITDDQQLKIRIPAQDESGAIEEISVLAHGAGRTIRLEIQVWVDGRKICPQAEAAGEGDGFIDLGGEYVAFTFFMPPPNYGRRAREVDPEYDSQWAPLDPSGAELAAHLRNGGFPIEQTSTGNPPGRPPTGIRSHELVPAEVEPMRGEFSLAELVDSVRRGGPKTERQRRAREQLARIVFSLTTRLLRPVREGAIAKWIGCSNRTVRNLKGLGQRLSAEASS